MTKENFFISKTFLSLSPNAKLGFMLAKEITDDDGFFEIFPLNHIYAVTAESLQELHDSGIVVIHDSDIARILDIRTFKAVRSNRYKPSKYCEKFSVEPLVFNPTTTRQTTGRQVVANGLPIGNQMTATVQPVAINPDNQPLWGNVAFCFSNLVADFLNKRKEPKENNNIYKYNNFFGKSENLSLPKVPDVPQEKPEEAKPKGGKKSNVAKKMSDGQVLGEISLFIGTHNKIHGLNRRPSKSMYGNWRSIRETYTVEEIIKSYENAVQSSFYSYSEKKLILWREILRDDPIRFLRTRNDKGPVDPVGRFLDAPEIAKQPDAVSKVQNNNFATKRGSSYYSNITRTNETNV